MKINTYLCFILVIFYVSCQNSVYKKKYVKNLQFSGVIIANYSDNHNHGANTLIIQDNYHKFELISDDFADLWSKACIGDSIIKIYNTYTIVIIKPNREKREYKYNCDY